MNNNSLAPHESLEIHEFLTHEMIEIKKISASIKMVNDTELKNFMNDSIVSKKTAIKEIQSAIG